MTESANLFLNHAKSIAPLESFDPQALVADDKYSKSVCDFVVALALAHNDLNDLHFATKLLRSTNVPHRGCRNRAWGLHCSISIHITKARAALFYEVAQLIRDNKEAIAEASFKEVIEAMPRKARADWTAVVAAASESRHRKTDLAKILGTVRDKAASHYDAGTLGTEYRRRFRDASETDYPLVSRGKWWECTRFFFADAIVETHLEGFRDANATESFAQGTHPIIRQVDSALFFVITGFISARSSWRPFAEEKKVVPHASATQANKKPRRFKRKIRK